jgi:hypothetical protein
MLTASTVRHGFTSVVMNAVVTADHRKTVTIGAERMEGAWSLRFGWLGCPDHEMRGGVVHIVGQDFIGGDQNFFYGGSWTIEGSAVAGRIDIRRHGEAVYPLTAFGPDEREFSADFIGEAIIPDWIEGRMLRPGHADIRIVMRRLSLGRP